MLLRSSHLTIRSATSAAHARVDESYSGFDLGDADAYARFLRAHAAAIIPLETELERVGMSRLLPDWPARRRSDAIRADLRSIAVPCPAALTVPSLDSAGAAWGAAYVLEGSRLGGAVLARQVRADLPRRYLASTRPGAGWSVFLTAMDAALAAPAALAAAEASALRSFEIFEFSARLHSRQLTT